MLALCEATDCRRVRLLAYFGEHAEPCGNCDNCLNPPQVWDATDCARKLLSTIYRVQQMSGISFGAGHIMDILRGKQTDKVAQFGHQQISTFGIDSEYSEAQLRSVLRQARRRGATPNVHPCGCAGLADQDGAPRARLHILRMFHAYSCDVRNGNLPEHRSPLIRHK